MLHILSKTIRKDEKLTEIPPEEFPTKWNDWWKNSYFARPEPNEDEDDIRAWNTENELGSTPIRPNGLGWDLIKRWQHSDGSKGDDYRFVDELHVDNLDEGGSIAAYFHEIKSTGCLAVRYGDELHGLLYIHCKDRHFFTDMEVRSLTALADQAAIAIRNLKMVGPSYQELFGKELITRLRERPWSNSNPITDEVLRALKEWAEIMDRVRGVATVDETAASVEKLAVLLGLPERFHQYY